MVKSNKKVIILGGLGNGSVVAAAMDDARKRGNNDWAVAGYLNDRMKKGTYLEGHPILGGLKDTAYYIENEYYFINTIYRIDGQDRRIVGRRLKPTRSYHDESREEGAQVSEEGLCRHGYWPRQFWSEGNRTCRGGNAGAHGAS